MESPSSELKKAREAKHLTLADISDATAINVRFLEAIERGDLSILPAPYIRAFIREYASVLGLDPVEVLRRLDQGAEPPAALPAATPQPEEPPAAEPSTAPLTQPEVKPLSVRIGRYAILAIVLIAFGIGVWNLWRSPSTPPEIPVSASTQDSTVSVAGPRADTTAPSLPAAKQQAKDSLTLSGTAKDSVWVLLQIDNRPTLDYILKPGQKFSWKARDRFLLSVGNAGGLDLTLNNKRLGAPGKRGVVVRNLEISRQLLAPTK